MQSRRGATSSASHLIRDARYAIDASDTVFAPAFKALLQRARGIGRRRPDLADATIKAYAHTLARELDRLLKLKPTTPKPAIFETPSSPPRHHPPGSDDPPRARHLLIIRLERDEQLRILRASPNYLKEDAKLTNITSDGVLGDVIIIQAELSNGPLA
jgi:hypothetical protein